MPTEQDTIVRQALEHLNCPTEGFIHIATDADAENLFQFINKAFLETFSVYRPKGLENRLTKVEQIHNLMEKGIFLLLTRSNHEQMMFHDGECSIIACVHIHYLNKDETAKETVDVKLSVEISLLAVHADMLKRGIGRYMVEAGEAVAKSFHCTHVRIGVLSMNKYMLDMYTKWGFNVIKTINWVDIGIDPKRYTIPCHVVIMEKELL